MSTMRIIISGGGTGGHVFPAIAIADALKRLHPDTEFLFVGAEGRMEMERVPKAGYRIEGLPIAGLHRQLTLRNIGRNLSFPYKLLVSSWKARRLVSAFRPDVVVGTGGYASGPVLEAAQSAGLPTVIQEQNSYAGITNKMLSRRASRICVAYEGMEKYFPAEKILFTGNPVRQDFLHLDGKRPDALRHFGLDVGKRTVAVVGGSLGSRTLNQAMRDSAALLVAQPDIQVLWQCGRYYAEEFASSEVAQLPQVKLMPFVDRMDLLYAAADVIISRAGALSISELCLAGKAAVLVPSPNVAEDHQTKNAQALVAQKAARLVPDAEAGKKMLTEALLILENEALAFSLGENIRQLARPMAADTIAREVVRLAGVTSAAQGPAHRPPVPPGKPGRK
jgi:UDP-N-acetylglucosamine--N-acetylmuramyl-(pentapeptide) pyrophosphoryl-undecaprenol N-acetylglucosamine transferase